MILSHLAPEIPSAQSNSVIILWEKQWRVNCTKLAPYLIYRCQITQPRTHITPRITNRVLQLTVSLCLFVLERNIITKTLPLRSIIKRTTIQSCQPSQKILNQFGPVSTELSWRNCNAVVFVNTRLRLVILDNLRPFKLVESRSKAEAHLNILIRTQRQTHMLSMEVIARFRIRHLVTPWNSARSKYLMFIVIRNTNQVLNIVIKIVVWILITLQLFPLMAWKIPEKWSLLQEQVIILM